MALAEIAKGNAPIQDERQFATFINLAYRIGRVADACSRAGASFTQEDVATLEAKRSELEAAWKEPSEAALSYIRKDKLEVEALLSSLTISDCPKLRLYYDGYMTVVLKANPTELVTTPN